MADDTALKAEFAELHARFMLALNALADRAPSGAVDIRQAKNVINEIANIARGLP